MLFGASLRTPLVKILCTVDVPELVARAGSIPPVAPAALPSGEKLLRVTVLVSVLTAGLLVITTLKVVDGTFSKVVELADSAPVGVLPSDTCMEIGLEIPVAMLGAPDITRGRLPLLGATEGTVVDASPLTVTRVGVVVNVTPP